MNILVTGGAGFIGSKVVSELISLGHKVTVLDNMDTGSMSKVPIGTRIVVGSCDVFDEFKKAFETDPIDVVCHLAGSQSSDLSFLDPIGQIYENCIAMTNLIDICAEKGVRKIVFASSGEVYGGTGGDIAPLSPFAICKYCAERMLRLYDFESTVLRIGKVYGDGSSTDMITRIGRLIKEKEKYYMYNGGNCKNDYVYIDDVVDAIVKATLTKCDGVIDIGTGIRTSDKDIVKLIEKALEEKLELELVNNANKVISDCILDTSKAKRLLDWKYSIGIEEGISKICKRMCN